MAKPRTLLGRQTDAALAELGLPVLEARTTDRVAYDEVRCRYCGKIQPTPMPPRPEKRNPFSGRAPRLNG